MKWLLSAALLTFGLVSFADTPRIDVDENHDPREEQQYDDLYEKDEPNSEVKQDQEESRINNDADPELDAVDDDMTEDEGLNDD